MVRIAVGLFRLVSHLTFINPVGLVPIYGVQVSLSRRLQCLIINTRWQQKGTFVM